MTPTSTGWHQLESLLGPGLVRPEGGSAYATPQEALQVRRILAIASDAGIAVVVTGLGARLSWGEPLERSDLMLVMRALDGIVDYAPDDMVVTAEAGVTLGELDAHLLACNQILPLEVPSPATTTLGGLVAAAPLSLSRSGYGEVRDWLLGVEVATPDGERVHGGGQVVKNVAGYDLCKLYAGSLGSLGAITRVTFKVRPRWRDSRLVRASLSLAVADPLLEAIQTTTLLPAVAALTLGSEALTLWLGFDGSHETVAWQEAEARRSLSALGCAVETFAGSEADHHRASLRDSLHGRSEASLVLRLSCLPSRMLACYEAASVVARDAGLHIDGSGLVHHGSLWLNLSGPLSSESWTAVVIAMRSALRALGAAATVVRAPGPLGVEAEVLDAFTRQLMRRIKTGLDSRGVMAPGRFRLGGNADG